MMEHVIVLVTSVINIVIAGINLKTAITVKKNKEKEPSPSDKK